jgi:hypothetical protein
MAKVPTPIEFYAALGHAIAQWSRVEDALCDLFIRLTICGLTGAGLGLGADKRHATGEGHFLLGNVFYSSTNFRSRLELLGHMIDRLVRDDALLTEWNAIRNKATKLYARRNVLAHGAAWGGDNAGLETMRYSVFSMQDQVMDFQQMEQAAPSFIKYAERITAFVINVNAHLAARKIPLPPSPEPSPS